MLIIRTLNQLEISEIYPNLVIMVLVAPQNPKTLRVSKLANSEHCFLRDLTYLSGLKKATTGCKR